MEKYQKFIIRERQLSKKTIYFRKEKIYSNEESMNSRTVNMYVQQCMLYYLIHISCIYESMSKTDVKRF